MTRVRVDMNLCQSHGECERVAPEIFHLGEDDVLRWKGEVDPSLGEKGARGRRRLSDAGHQRRGLMAMPRALTAVAD
jgi:ferredoxin